LSRLTGVAPGGRWDDTERPRVNANTLAGQDFFDSSQ
jgi:hypothetical protein